MNNSDEDREIARTVGPLALTGGALAGVIVLLADGPTWLAVVMGTGAFAVVVAIVESSLRRQS